MRRSTAASVCGVLGLMLVGCSSSTRTVALRVAAEETGGGRSPLAHAHVRLVRLASSPVPLPVNKQTMAEMGKQPPLCGWTDDDGVVRLIVHRESAHTVEVQWPMWSDHADQSGFRGVLGADGETLTVQQPGTDAAPAMVVEVLR